MRGKRPLWLATALGLGILSALGSRLYYAFVFLPNHHGSWSGAALRLIDFDGWLAYVTAPSGLVFHALIAVGFGAAAVLLLVGK